MSWQRSENERLEDHVIRMGQEPVGIDQGLQGYRPIKCTLSRVENAVFCSAQGARSEEPCGTN